ncbi:MAG TPA: hypothetical protein PLV57_03365 [Phycisphaerae bacterium]|nr:hypothetical protein [Phycisphaerae bacterium]HPP25531.1 hypothetical protein [Phycisphaerae bacterium]
MGRTPAISILITLLTTGLASADLAVTHRASAPGSFAANNRSLDAVAASASAALGIRPELLIAILQPPVLDQLPAEFALLPDRFTDLHRLPVSSPTTACFHGWSDSPFSDVAGADTSGENVIAIPPPPDGSILTLSGLLTLAGLQLARSARHAGLAALLHAAYVPDWYHADAVQVGHSVPFEFQPTLQPMQSVFGLIVPEADRPAPSFYRPDADDRIRSSQHKPLALAPRGPPHIS